MVKLSKRWIMLLFIFVITNNDLVSGIWYLPKNDLGIPKEWELDDTQLIIKIVGIGAIIEGEVNQKVLDSDGCCLRKNGGCYPLCYKIILYDGPQVASILEKVCRHSFKKTKNPYNCKLLGYRFEFKSKENRVVFYATGKGEIQLKGDENNLLLQEDKGENWLLEIMKSITYHIYDEKLLTSTQKM